MSTKVEKSELFSGKSDGLTFEKFDEKVLSWGRLKYGDKYATLLWRNELLDLDKLDLNDEEDNFDFEMHCTMVYDVLCNDSAKYADGLFNTQRF
jgi:phage terminase small subunit